MTDKLTALPTHRDPVQIHAGDEPLDILVDIDGFIWHNDQYGFDVGDRSLATVAAELKQIAETFDGASLLRIGGDEFLLILPTSSVADALITAAEIVQTIRALKIPYRRRDRPEATVLEVNVVVLRMTSRLVAEAFTLGNIRTLTDWASQRVYERKEAQGRLPGVVVDLHDADWLESGAPPDRGTTE